MMDRWVTDRYTDIIRWLFRIQTACNPFISTTFSSLSENQICNYPTWNEFRKSCRVHILCAKDGYACCRHGFASEAR